MSNNEWVAREACDYARSIILKSSNQAINQQYDDLQRVALSKGLSDLRENLFQQPEFILEDNQGIRNYYEIIAKARKFSLGNCTELALFALEHVVDIAPGVNAEYYHIKGGADHAFIVIGRPIDTNPNKPETWGDSTFICDPWANKVYPASKYLQELKIDFFENRSGISFIIRTEDFDPKLYQLTTLPSINSRMIRNSESEEHIALLQERFEKKSKKIYWAIEELKENLIKIDNRLVKEYQDHDEKHLVIDKLIHNLTAAGKQVLANIEQVYDIKQGQSPFDVLEKALTIQASIYAKAVKTTMEEKKSLWKYNQEQRLSTKCLQFFKIPPKTVRETNQALKEAHKTVKNIGIST